MPESKTLATRIAQGDRRALARAITLVESTRPSDNETATELIDLCLAQNRAQREKSLRLGLTGTPGVGKSTFIEKFGLELIEQGHRVAVLAVDPSSKSTGGSILGDKTRMPELSRKAEAFIRPSPSQNQLGGVSRTTREVIILCEAAGFNTVFVETVGVGQSETVVAQMTDAFLLLIAPGGGDELQGVKRGIMEMADLILVNKSDGALKETAMRTCAEYASALRLLRRRPDDPQNFPRALCVSALEKTGISSAWESVCELIAARHESGAFSKNRIAQQKEWLEAEIERTLLIAAREAPETARAIEHARAALGSGQQSPTSLAKNLAKAIRKNVV